VIVTVYQRGGGDRSVGTATVRSGVRMPIPVGERSKAKFCGRSLAGIAGSNPAGNMDVCVVRVVQ
jgi:hypothetical protein